MTCGAAEGRPEAASGPRSAWRQRAATGPLPPGVLSGGFSLSAETPSARGSVFTSASPHIRPPRELVPGLRSCCCRLVGDTQLCFPSRLLELLVSPRGPLGRASAVPMPGCRGQAPARAPLPVDRMRPVGLRRWPGPCGALERPASARVSGESEPCGLRAALLLRALLLPGPWP